MAIDPLTGQFIPGTAATGALRSSGTPVRGQGFGVAPGQTALLGPAATPGLGGIQSMSVLQAQPAGATSINPFTGQPQPAAPVNPGLGPGGFIGIDPATGAPPTGLIGAENALTAGGSLALGDLRSGLAGGIQDLRAGTQQATGVLDPFAQPGAQASGVQAALSGALGQAAQQEALANLQPVNQFLQSEGERAIARNAAAIGGLGGGNVRRELTRFGQGLAGQSAQQQFANLGEIAGRGFGAASQQGNILQQTGRDLLGARTGVARDIAGVQTGLGQQIAAGRTRAGEGVAGAIGGTTSALADLAAQQGAGLADITGAGAGNLANILAGLGSQAAGGQENLATILANLAAQQGSQVAGLPGIPGTQQVTGILESLASAASGAATAAGAGSDMRLKDNIQKVGVSAAGHNLYTWDWNEDGKRLFPDQPTFGVMAQELMKKDPGAVMTGDHGFLMVDYTRIH